MYSMRLLTFWNLNAEALHAFCVSCNFKATNNRCFHKSDCLVQLCERLFISLHYFIILFAVGCDVCYDVLWQTGKQLVYNYRNRQKTNATLPRKNNSKRKKRTLNTCNTSALLKCQTKANSLTQRRRRARATYRVYNPRLTVWILLMWYELSKSSESDGKQMNINRLMKIPVLGVNYV